MFRVYVRTSLLAAVVVLVHLKWSNTAAFQRTIRDWDHLVDKHLAYPYSEDKEVDVYTLRRQRLESVCESGNNNGNHTGRTENILVYRNMSYGVIPKAGCTFWIRVFRFLHNDTFGKKLRHPLEMTRNQAHAHPRKIKMFRLQKKSHRQVVMKTTRFLIARNPFTRLFSAYVDKFLLAGYWGSAGREIVRQRVNASEASIRCGHDVSFSEFLKHVTDVGEKNPLHLNGHWRPIEYYCNPCSFRPDIIGHQETFAKDARHILKVFGLGNFLDILSHRNHVVDEMTNLVYLSYGGSPCLTRKQLAGRIWKAFQINGYLETGSEARLNKEPAKSLNKNRLRDLVVASYMTSNLSRADVSRQRKWHLREAYGGVPGSIIDKIVTIFRNDFLYFGYNMSIASVF